MKQHYKAIVPITILLTMFILVPHKAYSRDYEKRLSLVMRGGTSFPLGEYRDRVDIYLPYFSLAFRIEPREYTKYLLVEFEAGFYSYKAKRDIAGKRAIQYSEPLMVHVVPSIHIWKGLFFYPRVGVGFILNQVEGSSSTGAYNHVGCAAGVEFLYRFSERIAIQARTTVHFGFDKNRVLYNIIPDLGIAVYF